MAAFDFRLEKVLRVREAIRKEKAREVSSARLAMDESERKLSELRRTREAATSENEGGRPLTAGELAAVHDLLALIDRHIEAEVGVREEVERRLQIKLQELTKAHGEEKALEILRERAYDEWLSGQLAAEQKQSDDVASRPRKIRTDQG